MNPSDNDKVGYGQPPVGTRFKPGQSGDPQKRKPRQPEGTLAMIDRLLLSQISVVLNGETKKVFVLEAIVAKLLQKAIEGNDRAFTVLGKYQEFAEKHGDKRIGLLFVDSEYTRSIAKSEGDHVKK